LSGLRFQHILEEFGIAEKIALKAKLMDGTLTDFALRHEVEIAITQPMEILATRDYGLVGPLPHKFQDDENFTWVGAVAAAARDPSAASASASLLCGRTGGGRN
jgi:hypothetical protein